MRAVCVVLFASLAVSASEFLVDTAVTYDQAKGRYCAVGSDGTGYLVVWSDEHDIFGTRVDQAGVVLDSCGIAVSVADSWQAQPAVGFGDSVYLVTWVDSRREVWGDVYGARVTTDGRVLDPDGIPVDTVYGLAQELNVAFDGTNFLVVWDDGGNVYGRRVSSAGELLDPTRIVVAGQARDQSQAAVAFDGDNYVIAWADMRRGPGEVDIYATRMTRSGLVLEPEGFPVSQDSSIERCPAIASCGSSCLVAWYCLVGYSGRTDAARVDKSGSVIDTIPLRVADSSYFFLPAPAIAFDGTNYLVVWRGIGSRRGTRASRISPSGVVLDPDGFEISASTASLREPVAFCGNHHLVVWDDMSRGGFVFGARVDRSGRVLEPGGTPKSFRTRSQGFPAAAFGSTNYLVSWREGSVYAARVTTEGAVLDSTRITVAFGSDDESGPCVAFDGSMFFAAWQAGWADIYGTPVESSGVVRWPGGRFVSRASSEQLAPELAAGDSHYLVVWTDRRFSDQRADIYGARVNLAGAVVDTNGIAISTAADEQRFPDVASGNNGYLVVWEDDRAGVTEVYFARVGVDGEVLDPEGIRVAEPGRVEPRPAVEFDGTNFLLVWSRGIGISGARVSQTGEILEPGVFAVSLGFAHQGCPSITFDGTNYVVVWEDHRHGFFADLYGAVVSPAGSVVDSFAVVVRLRGQSSPALACGPENQVLVVFAGWADSVGTTRCNAMRTWGKIICYSGVATSEDRDAHLTTATLVRSVLDMPSKGRADLLDISGRRVMELQPGPNGIRHVAPGVYFIRRPETEDGRPRTAVRKLIVQR